MSGEQRREEVLAAAICEFAERGFHGTPTEAIAQRAGISQPYLFRLYGTKKELFLACLERCFDRVEALFREAAADAPAGDEPLRSMAWAYVRHLEDRELLLFQLQTYAASADEDICAAARRRYEQLADGIAELTGRDRNGVLPFVGQGMLLNVAAALGLPSEDWTWQAP